MSYWRPQGTTGNNWGHVIRTIWYGVGDELPRNENMNHFWVSCRISINFGYTQVDRGLKDSRWSIYAAIMMRTVLSRLVLMIVMMPVMVTHFDIFR